MIMSFDKFGKYEQPLIILCDPGSAYVNGTPTLARGELTLTSDVEIIYNFNDCDELNLRAYYPIGSSGGEANTSMLYIADMFEMIQKYRYLFVNNIGYFRIDSVDDTTDGSKRTKDIKAISCDIELSGVLVPYIKNGTYPIVGYSQETQTDGILDIIVSSLPSWSIGHVDTDLVNLNRTFEDVDATTNIYDFLTESVQDAFECVVLFDIINREINVYTKDNAITHTDIHLAQGDLIDVLKTEDPTDGPYTAYRVFGEDTISVSAVNPIGGGSIYNFTYYIPWMPEDLADKVTEWQEDVEDAEGSYMTASVNYYTAVGRMSDLTAEKDRITGVIALYNECKSNIQAVQNTAPVVNANTDLGKLNAETIPLSASLQTTVDTIDGLIAEQEESLSSVMSLITECEAEIASTEATRDSIHESVAMESYFTAAELRILSAYIVEKTVTDTYIALSNERDTYETIYNLHVIYNRAKRELEKAVEPSKKFSIDTESFLFEEKFLPWANQLVEGCAVHVETTPTSVEEIFLVNVEVNYQDHSTRFTFGNKLEKTGGKSMLDGILGDVERKKVSWNADDYYYRGGAYITTYDGRRLVTSDGKRLVTKG